MSSLSYWCYRCSRFVRILNQDEVMCSDCGSGSVERVLNASEFIHEESRQGRFPSPAMSVGQPSNPLIGSHFHPMIVLHEQSESSNGGERRGLRLYYDDGGSTGMRPFPPNVTNIILNTSFGRLLEVISQGRLDGIEAWETPPPPASKAAIEAMPKIEIGQNHLEEESDCTICMTAFELGDKACEMPCKHKYHSGCILSWLSIRNSCPICRHELPGEIYEPNNIGSGEIWSLPSVPNSDITIWRLPGGGFAMQRIARTRRSSEERERPVVMREEGGRFNNGGQVRRIRWSPAARRERLRRRLNSVFGNMVRCFGISSSSSPNGRR